MRFTLRKLLIVLGFVALLMWPAVFGAGIMGLAAPRTGHEPKLMVILSTAFLVGSMAYRLGYCPCALISESLNEKSKSERLALALSVAPLVYLFAMALLLLLGLWGEEDARRETEMRWEKYGKPGPATLSDP